MIPVLSVSRHSYWFIYSYSVIPSCPGCNLSVSHCCNYERKEAEEGEEEANEEAEEAQKEAEEAEEADMTQVKAMTSDSTMRLAHKLFSDATRDRRNGKPVDPSIYALGFRMIVETKAWIVETKGRLKGASLTRTLALYAGAVIQSTSTCNWIRRCGLA